MHRVVTRGDGHKLEQGTNQSISEPQRPETPWIESRYCQSWVYARVLTINNVTFPWLVAGTG
jgi:hypothetical protein